ncbi:MAG TPA: tetratricopeptide repeat protein [Pyrinomonadaceae bacterium]|nr:tetratricopeptide repeat protein [Pyrinomonadaceae bacterium]HMP66407.1 tetratricopeptide repeat protein [Pyrinomonadaceae bacterium]
MRSIIAVLGIFFTVLLMPAVLPAQGDVRSATGMPIPIGQAVTWGKIELRGLRSGERKPIITVTLMAEGVELGRSIANDEGYYYFLLRPRDGAFLVVTVGGTEIGRQPIFSSRGDRFDMEVLWTDGTGGGTGSSDVVSVRDAYTERSAANQRLFERANAAAKAGRSNEAVKLFNEILTSDPNDFVAWTEVGSLHFTTKKNSDAEKAYKRALELKPDFAIALLNLGKLYLSQNKLDQAIEALTKAVEAEPNSPEAHHFLGETYLQARKGSLAVGHLYKAIELAPIEKAEIHLRLAALFNAAGARDRAAAEYKAFLEKVPDHAERNTMEKYIKDNSGN